MKAHLTLLRRDGVRLKQVDPAVTDRLVQLAIKADKGLRRAEATCCFGGSVLGVLWEPSLLRFSGDSLTLIGFENRAGAGTVQEWRIRPYST